MDALVMVSADHHEKLLPHSAADELAWSHSRPRPAPGPTGQVPGPRAGEGPGAAATGQRRAWAGGGAGAAGRWAWWPRARRGRGGARAPGAGLVRALVLQQVLLLAEAAGRSARAGCGVARVAAQVAAGPGWAWLKRRPHSRDRGSRRLCGCAGGCSATDHHVKLLPHSLQMNWRGSPGAAAGLPGRAPPALAEPQPSPLGAPAGALAAGAGSGGCGVPGRSACTRRGALSALRGARW